MIADREDHAIEYQILKPNETNLAQWSVTADRPEAMTNDLRVSGLAHAALLVSDLTLAQRFYGVVLGLKEKPRPSFDFPGAWYALGECELHLMVTSEPLQPTDKRPRRDNHIAFQVDDLEAAKRTLEEAGLQFRESSSGRGSIFVRDPDGNLIELQPPDA